MIALEGFAFVVLALLAIVSGMNLEAAESGMYGGIIGWGLAMLLDRFLPTFLAALVFLLVGFVLAVIGFGFTDRLKAFLQKNSQVEAGEDAQKAPIPVAQGKTSQPIAAVATPAMIVGDEEIGVGVEENRDDRLPPLSLLKNETVSAPDKTEIRETAARIEQCLSEFGVPAKVIGYRVGPTVTQFAVEPGYVEKTNPDGSLNQQKVRVSQIC